MRIKTMVAVIGLLMMVSLMTACPDRRSIAEIEANPGRFQNRNVVVAGIVRDSYGVNIPFTGVRGGVYKIDDGTGSIWVFTERSVPSKGTEIGVRGRLQNGLNYNGRNYGLGIYENERRFRGR